MPIWKFGDMSNRKRLYIIAIRKSAETRAAKFKFPNGKHNDRRYTIGLDIAVPDDQVGERYVTYQEPRLTCKWREPQSGKMYKIGDFGGGIGHCDNLNLYVSWLVLPSTQLTSNGGSRSTVISNQDNSIQRLKTINESMAIASLPDDYRQFTQEVNDDDKFTCSATNPIMGVHLFDIEIEIEFQILNLNLNLFKFDIEFQPI